MFVANKKLSLICIEIVFKNKTLSSTTINVFSLFVKLYVVNVACVLVNAVNHAYLYRLLAKLKHIDKAPVILINCFETTYKKLTSKRLVINARQPSNFCICKYLEQGHGFCLPNTDLSMACCCHQNVLLRNIE